jgi:hypothetical protein
MNETLLDLLEVTPLKLIISQVVIWGIALIYTYRNADKD